MSSAVVKNNCDGQATLIDGSGAFSLAVRFENGDFNADGHKAKLRNTNAYQSRGRLSSLRHTDRLFPSGGFSVQLSEFTGASALPDAIMNRNTWAAAQSTGGMFADVYTLDLKFAIDGEDFGDAADHVVTYEDCELAFGYAEGDPDTVNVTWTCYGSITDDLAVNANNL